MALLPERELAVRSALDAENREARRVLLERRERLLARRPAPLVRCSYCAALSHDPTRKCENCGALSFTDLCRSASSALLVQPTTVWR